MREFDVTLKKGLTVGLRPESNIDRTQEALLECQNVRVNQHGLDSYEDIVQPFSLGFNWPYTQLRKFERDFLVFDSNSVYRVDTSDWSKSSVISDSVNLSWHGADFGDYVVLTNGNNVYERDSTTGAYSIASGLPSFKTCEHVNGRLVVGNITNFYDCDSTFVAWSRVGDTTFEPGERQDSGYSPAWSGEIYQVKKLGKGFVAYGADGIRGFRVSGVHFEQKQIASFGIASRDAVDGDEANHLFMTDNGELWTLSSEFELNRLGYKEFFSPMLGNDIVVSYNPNPGEFYISDGNDCYLLYNGLSKVYQLVNGLTFFNGLKIGVIKSDGKNNFYLTTNTIDFGLRGFKKLESLELGIDTGLTVDAAVQWRSNKAKGWNTSVFRRVSQLGNVYIGIEANEFRIVIKTSAKGAVNLDYINARFKLSDKRAIRGTYSAD